MVKRIRNKRYNYESYPYYCIYGSGCDMQFGSSSSGGDWRGNEEESEECPSDVPASVSLRGEAYIVDNKAVYAYGDKAYSTSGRYLGAADGVIYSKISGFVDAWHSYDIKWKFKKTNPTDYDIDLSFKTRVDKVECENYSPLCDHEKEHVRIYNSLGNKDLKRTLRSCNDNLCLKIEEKTKSEFEKLLTNLVNAQNKFDDGDKNNISHERINLNERLKEMRKTVKDNLDKNCWENN